MILFFLLCNFWGCIDEVIFEFVYEIIGWFNGFSLCFGKRSFFGFGSIWRGVLVLELLGFIDFKFVGCFLDELVNDVGFLIG